MTRSASTGIMRSVLSKTNETFVKVAGCFEFPPLKMRSVSLSARSALELLGPRTKSIASEMLDLPEPLGPVTAVKPFIIGMVIFLPKDLKFSTSICFRNIQNPPE